MMKATAMSRLLFLWGLQLYVFAASDGRSERTQNDVISGATLPKNGNKVNTTHNHHFWNDSLNATGAWPFPTFNDVTANITLGGEKEYACAGRTTCEHCAESSLCHWCSHDEACHARGSIHGCMWGTSCGKGEKNDSKKEVSGCVMHSTCSECSASSHFCHWCAHDNACHSVGSVYGCVVGVNCFANDRCMRNSSEPIADDGTSNINQMGPLAFGIITSIGTLLFCCVSLCFCAAVRVKHAFDDLNDLNYQRANSNEEEVVEFDTNDDEINTGPQATVPTEDETFQDTAQAAEQGESGVNDESIVTEYTRMPENENGQEQQNDGETSALLSASSPRSVGEQQILQRRPRNMQRLLNTCACCYITAATTICAAVYGSIHYFPRRPVYNVCNNAVAWASLFEKLATMKAEAQIEILVSVANPNHIGIDLDMGTGSLTHEGAFVGTYEIPPVSVKAMSVTDILIVADLKPEKWEAILLIKEFWDDTLTLHVSAQVSVRIPALWNYAMGVQLQDLVVNVNNKSNRNLCFCQEWDPQNSSLSDTAMEI